MVSVRSARKGTVTMSRESVLVDSGFFFALYNQRDSNHAEAIEKAEWLSDLAVVIPWPILYDTVNTRFARRPKTMDQFRRILRKPDTRLIDDKPYRNDVFQGMFTRIKPQLNVSPSLVDSVVYEILSDVNVPVHAMLTFNLRDFERICWSSGVEIL